MRKKNSPLNEGCLACKTKYIKDSILFKRLKTDTVLLWTFFKNTVKDSVLIYTTNTKTVHDY